MKYVLGIETSCDDTSVAILSEDSEVLCCLVASQDLVHKPFGGVVPEIASRNHTANILPLIDEAIKQTGLSWDQFLGIAVTNRPGLVGSLIVGLVTAKTLALSYNIPFVGVHHIKGHIMAPFVWDNEYKGPEWWDQKFLALVVSGGHTQIYEADKNNFKVLGQTIDDAAGEAFDKFAKMMGLPYPGGVQVDRLAQNGDPKSYQFPKPMINDNSLNLSFSGLKSAAQRMLDKLSPEEIANNQFDLCASYQQTIVDLLIAKLTKAQEETGVKKIVVSGGVSANSLLRKSMEDLCQQKNCELAIPPLRYCTDNAAMIARAGLIELQNGNFSSHDLGPSPRSAL